MPPIQSMNSFLYLEQELKQKISCDPLNPVMAASPFDESMLVHRLASNDPTLICLVVGHPPPFSKNHHSSNQITEFDPTDLIQYFLGGRITEPTFVSALVSHGIAKPCISWRWPGVGFSEALAGNSALTCLGICGIGLDEEEVRRLGRSLVVNSTLRTVVITSCNASREWMGLRDAMTGISAPIDQDLSDNDW